MTDLPSTDLLHLTIDGGSVLSHADEEVLFSYAQQIGWMERDQHGDHTGSGIRITRTPTSIRVPMTPAPSDPGQCDEDPLMWRDAIKNLGLWAKPALPDEVPLWVSTPTSP